MKLLFSVPIFIFIFSGYIFSQSIEKMLNNSLDKISSLNCISYKSKNGSSAPYDSVIMNEYFSFRKTKVEKSDPIVGARLLYFHEDTSKISMSYYNNVVSFYDWDNKKVNIDTLNVKRPSLGAPFFTKVKGLLKYIIDNKDSVGCQVDDYKDSIKFSFTFQNKLVELNKVPSIFPKAKANSKYYLWTRKDYMPYRLKRQLPHQTSYEEIITLTNCDSTEIIEKQVGIFLPKGFKIADKKGNEILATIPEGVEAPNWTLKDLDGNTFNLTDYKGKNLLIEFTGVGCGACHLAISFLNKFSDEYKDKGFHVLSIESFSDNINALKRYNQMNNVKYDFLVADKKTVEKYKIVAVPVFILVNKNGIIEKVFLGYDKDETENKIKVIAERM